MARKGTRKSRVSIRNLRAGEFQNPTGMRRGSLVHRGTVDGRPLCGWFEQGIVYTWQQVTCPRCLDAPADAVYSSTESMA